MTNNLYISECCGACSHAEVCKHLENAALAKGLAAGVAQELPEPFKLRLYCSLYKSRC